MPPSILIIEDEPAIADTLLYSLASEGFRPQWRATGREGREALERETFALVILDVGLPDISGFALCQEIRRCSSVPILFLTARNNEIDRVVGLEMGGDDYVAKPFSPREVAARVRAILRRGPAVTNANADAGVTVNTNASAKPHDNGQRFTVDDTRFQIRFLDTPLDLTRIEFRLFKVLLSQPGRVFSREQLLTAAWDEPEASLDRTVDAHVKTIRAKLRAVTNEADPIIQTHRGLGYSLRED
ncbi:two-component system response regulator CreB [Geminisphaera colitermitum]|uniref:two-component system response regulator CreB n=1 Tax=Geminisphaera colitermitum TaxID=1148786 RepID=UPI000158D148|nr:two-component system response regulator CreB [Geminisphaera colitermitum]